MSVRGSLALFSAATFAAMHLSAAAVTGTASVEPQLIDDAKLRAAFTTMGGADVLPTTRTVPHWWGATTDPTNGVTYGYNMVGANPGTCTGEACDVTIEVDITPIIVNIDGLTFSGSDVLQATLDSPLFAEFDHGSTPAATNGGFSRGPGGVLSQGDNGTLLQLQDATMRSQFNLASPGSTYHLRLHPNILPAVTINVPPNQGTLLQSGRGTVFADVEIGWWSAQLSNLIAKSDATHLSLFLTDSVLLYLAKIPQNCCVIGYHGTRAVGNGSGSTSTNGNAMVQTFAWGSWIRPGIYARPNGGVYWALQDIHALSHEIAEWADDPFINNTVNPWLTPTAPQYGCTAYLETGDPVVGIGFALGTNTFDQEPNPNGTQSADGYYHPEDEAFLPWFLRTAPNTISEPTQTPSANVGRYTLMGDLNPFPGFRQPATGCL